VSWAELVSEPTVGRRGDRIVVVHHVRGRTRDGRWHENPVADVLTVEHGRIVHVQAYADPADALTA
jgi:ketosteroid isomerase-like protein